MANICLNIIRIVGKPKNVSDFKRDQLNKFDGAFKELNYSPSNGEDLSRTEIKNKLKAIFEERQPTEHIVVGGSLKDNLGYLLYFRDVIVGSEYDEDGVSAIELEMETRWQPYIESWRWISEIYDLQIEIDFNEPGCELNGIVRMLNGNIIEHSVLERNYHVNNFESYQEQWYWL